MKLQWKTLSGGENYGLYIYRTLKHAFRLSKFPLVQKQFLFGLSLRKKVSKKISDSPTIITKILLNFNYVFPILVSNFQNKFKIRSNLVFVFHGPNNPNFSQKCSKKSVFYQHFISLRVEIKITD